MRRASQGDLEHKSCLGQEHKTENHHSREDIFEPWNYELIWEEKAERVTGAQREALRNPNLYKWRRL